jgi:hypothetical protein
MTDTLATTVANMDFARQNWHWALGMSPADQARWWELLKSNCRTDCTVRPTMLLSDFQQRGISCPYATRERRDATPHDTTRQNTTRADTTRRDTAREPTQHESTQRKSTRHDATKDDATRHDTTRRDATRRDTPRREMTVRHDARRIVCSGDRFVA